MDKENINSYVDHVNIVKGEKFWSRIQQLIVHSDSVLVVLSPDSLNSEWCQWEIDIAESLNKRFITRCCR